MPKDTAIPSFAIPLDGLAINVVIPQTQAQLENQGYTYNQAGFTYNQAGMFYGGIYNNNQDVVPAVLSTSNTTPSISSISDIFVNNTPPPPNNQRPVGPGWWMYVSQ